MGLFDFFKKKETTPVEQEALDKGLEKTKEGLFSKLTKAVIGKSTVDEESWLQSKAWQILYPTTSKTDQQIAQASLKRTLERLPHILEGLV